MHTVIISKVCQSRIHGKYSEETIDQLIDQISRNPKQGKKFQAVNNLYKTELGGSPNGRHQYELVYFYETRNDPILLVNVFKKGEKDVLSKVISTLVKETW